MSKLSAAKQFNDIVLKPTLAAYQREVQQSQFSLAAKRELLLGIIACWRMVILLSLERSESLNETFKREALACPPLHFVRSWALAEAKVTYPRWVRPKPQPDEPIEMGYCFVSAARHLIKAADVL